MASKDPCTLARRHGAPREAQLAIEPGQRVRIDMSAARGSLPKDGWGLPSPEALRLTVILEAIIDATRFRPIVTEVRDADVEIATSFYGEGMKCLRIPRSAVVEVLDEPPLPIATSHGGDDVR